MMPIWARSPRWSARQRPTGAEIARGPWGARGLGEVMNMCLAPAVADAVHAATGVWFDEFLLYPERELRGLGIFEED